MEESKKISLDNGYSYLTAEEAVDELYNPNSTYCGGWDTIVMYMDDETREKVVYEADYPDGCTERQAQEIFLAAYLEAAEYDLAIG